MNAIEVNLDNYININNKSIPIINRKRKYSSIELLSLANKISKDIINHQIIPYFTPNKHQLYNKVVHQLDFYFSSRNEWMSIPELIDDKYKPSYYILKRINRPEQYEFQEYNYEKYYSHSYNL